MAGIAAGGGDVAAYVRLTAVRAIVGDVAALSHMEQSVDVGSALLQLVLGDSNFGVDRLGWGFRFPHVVGLPRTAARS